MTSAADLTRSSGQRFGYLWRSVNPEQPVAEYHYRQLRALQQPNVSAVRGSLLALPIKDSWCDFIFSYGVLHHLTQPEQGFRELVKALKAGGWITVYVYEDFSTHSAFERSALSFVGGIRKLTVRLPERALYGCCRLLAPLVFFFFTLPARLLGRWQWARPLAARIPCRHGKELKGLAGDLFDRFAAPIEYRYSEKEVRQWFVRAGLTDVRVFWRRGWVASGRKAAGNA